MPDPVKEAVAKLKELDRWENEIVKRLADDPDFEKILDALPLDGLSERDAEIVKINARLRLRTIGEKEEVV